MESTVITRKLTLDMGHRVPCHASGCRNLHGHTYCVEFSFIADALAKEGAAEGMVADFGHVKTVMMEAIHGLCDHTLMLYRGDKLLSAICPTYDEGVWVHGRPYWTMDGVESVRVVIVPFIPTAENLAKFWFEQVTVALATRSLAGGTGLRAYKIRVHETPNCYADYEVATAEHDG